MAQIVIRAGSDRITVRRGKSSMHLTGSKPGLVLGF
jgi:hypothetical protein